MSEVQTLLSTPSVGRSPSTPILVKLLEQSEHAIQDKHQQDSARLPAAAPASPRPLVTPKRLYTYD